MSSRDRWITVDPSGVIKLHSENDGWSFLRGGPDHDETVVTLDQLDGVLLQEAVRLIARRFGHEDQLVPCNTQRAY